MISENGGEKTPLCKHNQKIRKFAAQFCFMKDCMNTSSISVAMRSPSARYYNSDLSIWLSVDPMSDKYPSTSPYTYCANNPVRLVDPDGEDIIDVDQETGRTTITRQDGNDILRCGGKTTELSGNGVYRKALETGEKEGNNGGTLLMGMSKSDARKTFNFMADNTNVEWGYLETTGANGSNFAIGSAHDPDTESLIFNMAMQSKEGSVIRYDHNHLRTDYGAMDFLPSTPQTCRKESYTDTDAWNNLINRNPNVSLGIRHHKQTVTFIKDGKIAEGWSHILKDYFK